MIPSILYITRQMHSIYSFPFAFLDESLDVNSRYMAIKCGLLVLLLTVHTRSHKLPRHKHFSHCFLGAPSGESLDSFPTLELAVHESKVRGVYGTYESGIIMWGFRFAERSPKQVRSNDQGSTHMSGNTGAVSRPAGKLHHSHCILNLLGRSSRPRESLLAQRWRRH